MSTLGFSEGYCLQSQTHTLSERIKNRAHKKETARGQKKVDQKKDSCSTGISVKHYGCNFGLHLGCAVYSQLQDKSDSWDSTNTGKRSLENRKVKTVTKMHTSFT